MTTASEQEGARLRDAITKRLATTAAEVTPWFVAQMPPSYFRDLPTETVEDHLSAIIAARSSGQPLALTLKSDGDDLWTFINAEDRPGLLASLVDQLPRDRALNAARIYTAIDGQLVVDVFSFREAAAFDGTEVDQQTAYEQFVDALDQYAPHLNAEAVRVHCERCRSAYVLGVTPKRFFQHMAMYTEVAGTENVSTHVEAVASVPGLSRLVLAAANADPTSLFRRTARYLSTRGIDVRRAYLEAMGPADGPIVSMISLVVANTADHRLSTDHAQWRPVLADLARLPWLDRRVLVRTNTHHEHPRMSLVNGEILVALSDLIHQRLGPASPYRFSRDRVEELVFDNVDAALDLAAAIGERFESKVDDDARYSRRIKAIMARSPSANGGASGRQVIETLCQAALAIQHTNLHCQSRYALGLTLDPAFLHGEAGDHRAIPYGVLYFFGRMFHGFHVRFRAIARGGLRVVRPRGPVAYFSETNRLYNEAWGLANAQQLKNKDIPEGGSKGVLLATPAASNERVVKALGDTLLDLTLGASLALDELIYLGPDENITDDLIMWLVQRAADRGHPAPNAFMSSKPGAGINHKEFGVTSEGVVVFLEAALKARGFNPRTRPFTVKLTGGPDGDVAGNAIRIMHREFGENTRVVAIADGSGSAEDPKGLALGELLRLVDAGLGIAHFNPTCLGPGGRVLTLDDDGGLEARNTLHNRVVADAFLPCGGRPAAVNGTNWARFLDNERSPSAMVVVEGANLFFTEAAREALAREANILFVKDSSANKCGVICSSFEIAASLLIDEATFLAIKPQFVGEILDRLRHLARKEASVLFSQYKRRPEVPLSQVSVQLSDAINRMKDAIIDGLVHWSADDLALADLLVNEHLPTSLRTAAGQSAIANLPRTYFHRVFASVLASEIVYREGVEYLNDVRHARLAPLALSYLRHLVSTKTLIDRLSTSQLPERSAIIALLQQAGLPSHVDDPPSSNT
ncbi:MAG: hypothetical protein VX589_05060 [Myxococcota bacterium]|nr:hypothetical protein [Myxococcota bacterium]